MAISPIVNSFMQQGEQPQSPTDAGQIFKNQFSDMAFNALRAKFPALINNVVTLKTMAADVEKGTAFGVFVVSSGNDLVYVPVAMADGSIVSCEMMYDKEADQFYPLDAHTVKEIIARSKSSDPTMLENSPHVEDTRRLFHNMVRPPASSNVVLAGMRAGIAELPDRCKKSLGEYLTEKNPRLLGKIASFYPVEVLADRLSPSGTPAGKNEEPTPAFIKRADLSRDAARALSTAERKTLLRDGWLVKSATDSPLLVLPGDGLKQALETELELSLYPQGDDCMDCPRPSPSKAANGVARARLLQYGKEGISFVHVLCLRNTLLAADGRFARLGFGSRALVSGLSHENVFPGDFPHVVPLSGLRAELKKGKEQEWFRIHVLVPGRSGRWLFPAEDWGLYGWSTNFNITDDSVSLANLQYPKLLLSDALSRGHARVDKGTLVVPKSALFVVEGSNADANPLATISSFENLLSVLTLFANPVAVFDNGAGISINDKKTEKTASFKNSADAAEWLHGKYGLDQAQIRTVLAGGENLLFTKMAFLDPDPAMLPPGTEDPYSAQGAALTERPMMGEAQRQPDFSALEDFAELEDPEMLDAGILASFAQYPDAKSLLVEYMPDFLAAEDKIGRVLLLFSSQKKEIEAFYGSEKCSTLIASLRRIFSILGELVASLKLYVNMA